MVVIGVDPYIKLQRFHIVYSGNLSQHVGLIDEGIGQYISAFNIGFLATVVDDGKHAEVVLQTVDFNLLASWRHQATVSLNFCLTRFVINAQCNFRLCKRLINQAKTETQNGSIGYSHDTLKISNS